MTVDGRSGGLGSPGDRRIFQVLRALADVVLVGHGTAAAEGYRPITADSAGRPAAGVDRPAADRADRRRLEAGIPGPGERTGHRCRLPHHPGHLRVVGRRTPGGAGRRRRGVLVCGDDEVDLPLALDRLAELGHEQVLCEGGPTLFRDALTAGVVDELDLSIAPALVGGSTAWSRARRRRPAGPAAAAGGGRVLFARYHVT